MSKPSLALIVEDILVSFILILAKDKAVKRFTIRDIVDASSKRDLK
jgi:hypothetical protein